MFREVVEAIRYTVQNKIPKLKQVDLHGGGFSGIEDVRSFATYAPSVKVGISDISDEFTCDNRLFCILNLSMLLVTKDRDFLNDRYLLGLDYLEELKLLVKEGLWKNEDNKFLTGIYKPEKDSLKSKSFFGPQLFNEGVAIWLISWQQKVVIGRSIFDEEGELPLIYDVTSDIKSQKKDTFECILKENSKYSRN